jgi:hypothetical protein
MTIEFIILTETNLTPMNLKINHLAVWLCIVLQHGLGFLWYGPLFGEKWMALVKLDLATMQADSMSPSLWILNSISIIAPNYLLAWLFAKLNIDSGARGAIIAFMITFCFHHLSLMNSNMFAGEPYALAWITGGYSVTCLTISGFILGSWLKRD